MTISTLEWARAHTLSLPRPVRARRTPVEASAADRERNQLRRENRRQLDSVAYQVALQQLWTRR